MVCHTFDGHLDATMSCTDVIFFAIDTSHILEFLEDVS